MYTDIKYNGAVSLAGRPEVSYLSPTSAASRASITRYAGLSPFPNLHLSSHIPVENRIRAIDLKALHHTHQLLRDFEMSGSFA